jgi:acyl-CoA dehydrogenase
MDSILSFPRTVFREDHEMYRETVRKFLAKECAPRQAEWDAAGKVDRETWLKAGKEGLLLASLSEENAGAGGDFGHCAIAVEEIAYAGISGPGFYLHSDIIAPYIARLGNAEQKAKWLPKAASGECILAIAMSEPGAGSDLKAIRTTAIRNGDHYLVNGSKTFISNGLNCDLVVLVCKTDPEAGSKGVSLLLVEADRPGFRKGRIFRRRKSSRQQFVRRRRQRFWLSHAGACPRALHHRSGGGSTR